MYLLPFVIRIYVIILKASRNIWVCFFSNFYSNIFFASATFTDTTGFEMHVIKGFFSSVINYLWPLIYSLCGNYCK